MELLAYSVFGMSVTLAVTRPRVHPKWRIGPAQAALFGVAIMFVTGLVDGSDVVSAAQVLWRPMTIIVSIMVTAATARRLGVLDAMGARLFAKPGISPTRLLVAVFLLGVVTASLLSNDAAILVLTPLVLVLVRQRYPAQPRLLVPFAFAVFASAGVAPLVVSNPMNMVVASYANVNFNQYVSWMAPIAAAGWVVTLAVLLLVFRAELRQPIVTERPIARAHLTGVQKAMIGLLVLVVAAYPVVAFFDGPTIWVVTLAGSIAALTLASRRGGVPAREVLAREVSWDILVFLLAIFVLAIGLRNVGVVDHLTALYERSTITVVGATAAVGSAVVNNHSMAIINMLALDGVAESGRREIFAILIGGDLGPRLLPIGSLAGLLWLESCRRLGVEISLRRFVTVGLATAVPTLAVSLLLLALR